MRSTPWGRGLTELYTGDGKGKTTAAMGLALRAAGHGASVLVCQFLKGRSPESGELSALHGLGSVEIRRYGDNLVREGHDSLETIAVDVQRGVAEVRSAVEDASYDLVVLDEICVAVSIGAVDEAAVLGMIAERPAEMELVLTGRGAGARLIEACDLVTELKPVKHPFDSGIGARRGIEY